MTTTTARMTTTTKPSDSSTTTSSLTTPSSISKSTTIIDQETTNERTTTTTNTSTTPPKCPLTRLFGENCWDGTPNKTRIMGGEIANANEYPYHVGLALNGSYICGGSIISESWVLTAAHCVRNQTTNVTSSPNRIKILYNSTLKTTAARVQAIKIVVHPKTQHVHTSKGNNSIYDIALVKVEKPFDFSLPGVKPICFLKNESYGNTMGTVTGWGRIPDPKNCSNFSRPDNLHKVRLDIITNDSCQKKIARYKRPVPPDNTFICTFTEDKNTMKGDSGGPLVAEVETGCWVQLGIVSFGITCATFPGVYTRVSTFADWIQKNAV